MNPHTVYTNLEIPNYKSKKHYHLQILNTYLHEVQAIKSSDIYTYKSSNYLQYTITFRMLVQI